MRLVEVVDKRKGHDGRGDANMPFIARHLYKIYLEDQYLREHNYRAL